MKEGYKKTEVGVIPEDWEFRTLEQISEFITKGSTPTTYGFDWVENGILFMKSDCVDDKGFKLGDTMQISQEAHEYMKRSEVKSGDLLISITGNIGRVGIIPNYIKEANINQHIARIRVQDIDNVNNKYLYYTLSRKEVLDYYEKIKTGLAYPQISLKQVRETKVILPPLKEQEKIAEILSTVDCQIDDTEKLIEKCRVLKKGLMQSLLTKGIGHFEFKKSEVGEIPVGWEVVALSNITDVRDGTHDSPQYVDEGIPFITSKNLKSNGIDFSEVNYITRDDHEKFSKRSDVSNGDILFGMIGTIGNPVIVKKEFEFSIKNVALIKFIDDRINNVYLLNILKSSIIEKQFAKLSNGGVQKFISLGMIRGLNIPLPSKEEQEKISQILSSLDNEIEGYENKKQRLEEIKKGLIQQLLTGKIKVIV